MNSYITSQRVNERKVWDYFQFILRPHTLDNVQLLSELNLRSPKDPYGHLFTLIKDYHLECYQITVKLKKHDVILHYLDLETPIVFIPLLKNEIEYQTFRRFSTISKVVKTHLSTEFNQDLEVRLIQITEDTSKNDSPFLVYKPEDQRLKIDQKQSGNVKKLVLKRGKRTMPFGKWSPKNKLNLLTGREWLKVTKSWMILRPPRRRQNDVLHPAKFPEKIVRMFITFFTKPGELIVDTFLGSGSTIIAAKQSNRNAIGIELAEKYVKISRDRLTQTVIQSYPPLYNTDVKSFWKVVNGNSLEMTDIWRKNDFPIIDFAITSPPYWSQLDRDEIRQKERKTKGLDTKYSTVDPHDLGNIENYEEFLKQQKMVFDQLYSLMKPNGYMVIITNNIFTSGRLYPLAYDTATSLADNWILKDEKIWLQDDKRLLALGVNNAWVGNRCHQYCLIFRKES
ncbi:MAG: DNA methyltransferase [Candidatus Hodarchaeales archaeon]